MRYRTVIAARNLNRAKEVAKAKRLAKGTWLLLNGIHTLPNDLTVTLYVDPSWPGHIYANSVQDAIEMRMAALLGPPRTNLGSPRRPLRAT